MAGWAAIAVALVVIVGLGALITPRPSTSQGTLDPRSTGADGARALVSILEKHGVTVQIVTDPVAAHDALEKTPATLWLPDSPALTVADLLALTKQAAGTVVGDPAARSARVLFGATLAGYGRGVVSPACTLPAAQRAGGISPGVLFRATGADTSSCYPQGDAVGLVTRTDGARQDTIVDGTRLFTNEHLGENGNAALAINLLGARDTLVWLAPEGGNAGAAPTLADLTPGWVTPLVVLGFATALAAAIWRGRRFGPLVAERLPVTVRASETAEGRAHLYARAADPAHAYELLRAAAARRIATALGLGRRASAGEVADAAAAVTGRSRADVRTLLVDARPGDDRALVDLATRLYALENAVHAAILPEGTARDR
ncbi:hypothetical protein LK09_08620 [Microbacterium mangrovi]|uniref:DUF4350 domain-containing protein n=1 Tax=Microbacterium mangrovi TaxID=1348253 RepID=A0A0B2ABA6_9MICO|nr:hypothetical protein LK09_08620 [Microbacterium mangrovi]